MLQFLRLENLILPVNQIKSVTTPTVNGESIVEVEILALTDTFKFDGQAATRVYEILKDFVPAPTSNVTRKIVVTVDGVSTIPVSLILPNETISSIININGVAINTDAIEWADLSTVFDKGVIGVELRLSTDAPGNTYQYKGTEYSAAYDVLDALAPLVQVAAA